MAEVVVCSAGRFVCDPLVENLGEQGVMEYKMFWSGNLFKTVLKILLTAYLGSEMTPDRSRKGIKS